MSNRLGATTRPHVPATLVARLVVLAVMLGGGLVPAIVVAEPGVAVTAGVPLSGRVSTAGAGVAGVSVTVHDLTREGAVVATATTNQDGEYAVAQIEPGDYAVVATPSADDPRLLASATVEQSLDGVDVVADLVLTKSNVRGTVTRADGAVAADAAVEVRADRLHLATTYPDGSFRLALPPGGWRLSARPPVENPALDVPRSQRIDVVDGAVATTALTLLQPNLRGTALAPGGSTALSGALVQVADVDGAPVAGMRMSSRGDGSFGFHLPAGSYRLEITPPRTNPRGWVGYLSDVVEIGADHSPEAPAIQDLPLRGPTLTGVVRAPGGDPVPRAFVHGYSPATGRSVSTRSDETGHYGLDIPAGEVTLNIYPPNATGPYLERTIHADIHETPFELDLTFVRPNVTGRVVSESGTGVGGAEVQAYGPTHSPDAATFSRTDRQGRFRLYLDPGSSQRIVADPPASVPGVRTGRQVEIPANGPVDLELMVELPRPATYDIAPLETMVDGRVMVRASEPVLSRDGGVVAVRASSEPDCHCEVEPDVPGRFDGVVLHDLQSGDDQAVRSPDGAAVRPAGTVALDGDGSRVAFVTAQDGLVVGDDDGDFDAFVLDRPSRTLHQIEPAADAPDAGLAATEFAYEVALSASGSRLVLGQSARNQERDLVFDLVVVDLDSTGDEVSRHPLGIDSSEELLFDLSGDGRTLTWAELRAGAWGLHVLDLASGEEDPVRPFSGGVGFRSGAFAAPSISTDGSVVAYPHLERTEGPEGYADWRGAVRIADRSAAGSDRVVDLFAADGGPIGRGVDDFVLSGDGAELFLTSTGPHPEETQRHAWLVDLSDDSSELISRTRGGRPARGGIDTITASADFATLALAASSEDLTGQEEEFVALATVESAPPHWPADATISARPGDIGTTSARLSWSEATDNLGVAGYRIRRGGEVVGVTSGATRQLVVGGLAPDTSYTFSVEAFDARGIESTGGPSTTVRTLPDDSSELRPLEVASGAGGRVDLGWEPAGAVDALLLRTYVGDVQVGERTLAADMTAAREQGLAADTTYTFQIFTRTGDTVRPFTGRTSVTTPQLTFTGLTWSVPTVRGNAARRGSTATITATAETGRAVTVEVRHRSWFDDAHQILDAPRILTSVVPLTELDRAPGTYQGGFDLVDGIARVEGMAGTVTDGHGGRLERTSPRGPIRVSSEVVLTVDAPRDSLPDGQVQLSSEAADQAFSQPVAGGTVLTLDHLLPAEDWMVEVAHRFGVADQVTNVGVRDGLQTAVTLDPALPASLTVAVRDGDGVPVVDSRITVRTAGTGAFVAGLATDEDGLARLTGLEERQKVEVEVVHPGHRLLVDNRPDPVALSAGESRLDLVAEPVARALLAGVVRHDDGEPIPDARVTLSQQRGAKMHLFTANTDARGAYEISGLRATGSLAVRSGMLRDEAQVNLGSGPAAHDFTLAGASGYQVRLRLFTREPGAGEVGPIPVDWRTFVDLPLRLTLDGRTIPFTNSPIDEDGSVVLSVNAYPGEVLEWCRVTTIEACTKTALMPSDRSPVLELHTQSPVPLKVSYVDGAGQRLDSVPSEVFEDTADGRKHVVTRPAWSSTAGSHWIPRPGTYVLVASKGNLSGERIFTVDPDDTMVTLPALVLRERRQFSSGENAVVTSRQEVLPATDVEMRAGWRNGGPTLSDVVARIEVPAATTLVPNSLVLDGRPVPGVLGNGYVDVALGAVSAGEAGNLRYRLRVPTAASGRIAGAVEMRWGPDSDPVIEVLRPTSVEVTAVTVTGPATVSSDRIPLSGRAPAGSTVRILDGGVALGSAVAGPGGFWTAVVTLVQQPLGQPEHRVVAETVLAGRRFFAEHVVTVDSARPVVTRFSIWQLDHGFPNGRRFDVDPRNGVARFPFVFVPNQPTVFEVSFDEPSLVSKVDVLVGDRMFRMTRLPNGVHRAQVEARSLAGEIRINYDAIAIPIDLGRAGQTDREIRDGVPAPLQGFELSDIQQPDPDGSDPRTGSFTMSIPSVPGGSVRTTLTVSQESYAPTAADLAMQRATGSPTWGVRSTRSGNTLNFSMLVPLSEIPGMSERAESDGTPMGRALAQALRDAVGPAAVAPAARAGAAVGVARVGYQLAFNGTTTLDSLLSALGAGDKYDKLAKALDRASGCSGAVGAGYAERAENIALAAAAGDIGGAAFNIAALVFGPATFGLGTVALGVLGWAMDKAIGYAIDQATETLMNDIKNDEDCKKEEDDSDDLDRPDDPDDPDRPDRPRHPDRDPTRRDDRVADPVWIYDPSGFVYEGARSVRVPGVTATLLTAPTENGPWSAWDAEWFGQINPQDTDDAGRYGWDVPEGWWQVVYTKDGYQTARSRVLRVLPPHLDVDVSMVKEGFPHVTGSVLRSGGVEVTFDRLVRSVSAERDGVAGVVDAEGAEVAGVWTPLGATTGDGDRALQRGLRFVPAKAPAAGAQLTVTVDGIADYSGRLMSGPYSGTVTVPTTPGPVPGDPGNPGNPEPAVPSAPTGVTATAGERRATVEWTPPDDNGAEIVDQVVTVLPSGRQVTVAGADPVVEIDGLSAGTTYSFTVTARNVAGSGPVSAPSNEVVPTAVSPDTVLTLGPTGFVLSRSATVAWAPTGDSYVCELDAETWPCDDTTTVLSALGAGTHTFTVAAVDADGDVDPTPAVRRWTVPRDDRSLSGKAWQRTSDRRAYLGTYSQTRRPGATLRARFHDATEVALVVGRGRGHGVVTVYLGGKRLRAVDLSAQTLQHRQLIRVGSFDSPRSGNLRIVVTSRRGLVRIDGLAVATD